MLAESPRKGFAPSPGTVRRFLAPAGPGVRVDSGIESGTRVPSGFDSLLAKVIAAGADLGEAAGRLVGALENTVVHGLETNLQFLAAVLRHPDFLSGRTHSGWVEERLAELTAPALPEDLAETLRTPRMGEAVARIASGRRESQGAQLFRRLGERPFSGLAPGPGPGEVLLSEAAFPGAGRPAPFRVAATELEDRGVAVSAEGETLVLGSSRAAGGRGRAAAGGEVRAPLAGRLLSVRDEPGVPVESGEVVAVIESMKMHWEIRAPAAGRLRAPEASAGDTLPAGALILTIARRSTARFDASRPDTTEPPP